MNLLKTNINLKYLIHENETEKRKTFFIDHDYSNLILIGYKDGTMIYTYGKTNYIYDYYRNEWSKNE